MKKCYYHIYAYVFLSFVFSINIDSFLDAGAINKSMDSYSSLNYESEDVLEGPVDPNEYKVGVGDQFLFSMLYPSGNMNLKLNVSPLGEILIPQVGKILVNEKTLVDAFKKIEEKCLEKYDNAEVNINEWKSNDIGTNTGEVLNMILYLIGKHRRNTRYY